MKPLLLALVLAGCSKPAPTASPSVTQTASPEPTANPLKEDVELVCATKFGGTEERPAWQILEPEARSPELKEMVAKLKRGTATIDQLGGWLEETMPKVGVTTCDSLAGMKPLTN